MVVGAPLRREGRGKEGRGKKKRQVPFLPKHSDHCQGALVTGNILPRYLRRVRILARIMLDF